MSRRRALTEAQLESLLALPADDTLRRRGEVIPDALLAHLAPLRWQHINLTGDNLRGNDGAFGPDGFRQVRGESASPIAIAA